jgi:hypothetical protein
VKPPRPSRASSWILRGTPPPHPRQKEQLAAQIGLTVAQLTRAEPDRTSTMFHTHSARRESVIIVAAGHRRSSVTRRHSCWRTELDAAIETSRQSPCTPTPDLQLVPGSQQAEFPCDGRHNAVDRTQGDYICIVTTQTAMHQKAIRPGLSERLMDVALHMAAFSSSWSAVSLGGFNIVDWFLAATLFCAISARLVQRRPIYLSFWMVAPFVAAFLVEAAALFLARSTDFSGIMVLRVFLATAVIAVLIHSFAISNSRDRLVRLLSWWAAGIAVSAGAAVLVANGRISLAGVLTQATGDRLSGLAAHPNGLAFSLSVAFPVFVYFVRNANSRGSRFLWLVASAISVWALFLSDSRSGLLVGLASFGLSIFVAVGTTRGRIFIIPVLTVAGVLALWKLPDVLAGTRLLEGAPQSDLARTIINTRALDEFIMSPLVGGGFSALGGVAVPLQVISAGGVVFAFGYYLFLLRPLASLWRTRTEAVSTAGLLVILTLLAFGVLNPVILERAAFWPGLIALFYVRATAGALPTAVPWNAEVGRPAARLP